MPAGPESLALAEQYRLRTVALRAMVIAEFVAAWQSFPGGITRANFDAFMLLVTALVRRWQPVFQQVAADYYIRASELDTGARPVLGGFVLGAAGGAALAAPPVAAAAIVASLTATAFDKLLRGRFLGRSPAEASERAMVAGAESVARLAAQAGREQIERLVQQDQRAVGWMRVTDGDPCAFCLMLASRGPVYKDRQSALFVEDPIRGGIGRYHDKCACQAVPVFTRNPTLPESTTRAEQMWEDALREARESGQLSRGTSNDSLNALRRHMDAQGLL